MLRSHQFEDAVVSQSVSEDHNAVLRAASGCLPHGQGQGVHPGTKAQHAGAVGPHAPHTWNRADCRTDEEREKKTQSQNRDCRR